jgi:hypothetical protein
VTWPNDWPPRKWTTVLPQPASHFGMTMCEACCHYRKDHVMDRVCMARDARCSCTHMTVIRPPAAPSRWAAAKRHAVALLLGLYVADAEPATGDADAGS